MSYAIYNIGTKILHIKPGLYSNPNPTVLIPILFGQKPFLYSQKSLFLLKTSITFKLLYQTLFQADPNCYGEIYYNCRFENYPITSTFSLFNMRKPYNFDYVIMYQDKAIHKTWSVGDGAVIKMAPCHGDITGRSLN